MVEIQRAIDISNAQRYCAHRGLFGQPVPRSNLAVHHRLVRHFAMNWLLQKALRYWRSSRTRACRKFSLVSGNPTLGKRAGHECHWDKPLRAN